MKSFCGKVRKHAIIYGNNLDKHTLFAGIGGQCEAGGYTKCEMVIHSWTVALLETVNFSSNLSLCVCTRVTGLSFLTLNFPVRAFDPSIALGWHNIPNMSPLPFL